MIKIQSTQPTFIKGENIQIKGQNFNEGTVYNIYILNSFNNNVIHKITEIEPEDKQTLSFGLSDTDNLEINTYYKIYIEDNSTGERSNMGIIKCIATPTINVSFQNNIITIEGQGLRSATISFSLNNNSNLVLIKSPQLYIQNNNQISYTVDFKITKQVTTNDISSEYLQTQVQYEIIDNYTGIISRSDMISIQNQSMENINIRQLGIEEQEMGYISVSNDDNVSIYKRFDSIQNNNNIYDIWYLINNKIDKNIKHNTMQYYYIGNSSIFCAKTTFEHIYLTDNTYNYCIKFNPKISGLKYNRQETKVETLGSQYPFIFRNGNTNYREFQISGLISRLADWGSADSVQRTATPGVNVDTPTFAADLNDANIYAERIYREQFLDWLNNGEYKVFKSPTEGNMIVRLMNVSLSPEDKLGRMLYNFSATVIEVAEYNYENLKKYNLL